MTSDPGTVVLLSGDLLFASRVQSAAKAAGLKFRFSGSLPDDQDQAIQFVILDLSHCNGLTELAGQCAARCPDARLIAYGPHVQAAKLAAAKEAGIPTVLTKGQFDRELPTLFQ